MLKVTKKGDKAWVTFSIIPQEETEVFLCGDWNDWDEESMKVKKNGERYLTKVLKCDEIYQFGYKVAQGEWLCDEETECVESPYGSKNSVLKL
jgi:1,4-alpha-glucan branching enzyme